MKRTVLAARRQVALERLAAAAEKLTPDNAPNLVDLPKGNTEHRQLFLLERLADWLEGVVTFPPVLDEYDPNDPTYSTPMPADVSVLPGIGDELARVMRERGLKTVEDVRRATLDELTAISGIGQVKARALQKAAKEHGRA